jgi:hypothetical protein
MDDKSVIWYSWIQGISSTAPPPPEVPFNFLYCSKVCISFNPDFVLISGEANLVYTETTESR